MIAVDTNLLVYAHRKDCAWHERAGSVLRDLDAGKSRWAIPWPCVYEFYNIVTHPRIFPEPTPPSIAWEAVGGFLASSTMKLLAEETGHFENLMRLLGNADLRGPKIHDARIAVICHTHRVDELWSMDRDFSRFPFLKVVNPLLA